MIGGMNAMIKCTWGQTAREDINHAKEPLFLRNGCCEFPEHILYRIHQRGCFVKETRWVSVPIVDAQTSRVLSVVHVAQLSIGRIEMVSSTWSIEIEQKPLYFLKDGTSYTEYQKCMRDEETLKGWWESPKKCGEIESKDAQMHRTLGVIFGHDQIPDPHSLSPNNTYLMYRGPYIKLRIPVYTKVKEQWTKKRKEVLYKYSHIRTLFKFAAFYRVQNAPVVYKFGGYHVFARSGRRLVGNPWFNHIPNSQYVLGVPFEDNFGRPFPQCPRFWHWQYDEVVGWRSRPID